MDIVSHNPYAEKSAAFVQLCFALIAFRRFLKNIVHIRGTRQIVRLGVRRNKSSLKRLIALSNSELPKVRIGVAAVELPEREKCADRDSNDVDIEELFDHKKLLESFRNRRNKDIRGRAVLSFKGKGILKAENHLEIWSKKANVEIAARLRNTLKASADAVKFAEHLVTKHVSQENHELDLSHILHKNKFIEDIENHYSSHANHEEYYQDAVEYLPGTALTFGSAIALQANHGSYLRYSSDDNEISASAGRVILTTRFLIVRADNQYDFVPVKYGDKIALKCGDYEALGVSFSNEPNSCKKHLTPRVINIEKGRVIQSNCCWIILNKDDPIGTIGKQVLHKEKIMLEQEWLYLASSSPKIVRAYKYTSKNSTTKQYFQPGEESCWVMILVGSPTDSGKEVQIRARILNRAVAQLGESLTNRDAMVQKINSTLGSTLKDELNVDRTVLNKLDYKLNESKSKLQRLKLFVEISTRNFLEKRNNPEILAQIYGNGSNIYKYRKFIFNSQAGRQEEHKSTYVFASQRAQEDDVDPVALLEKKIYNCEQTYWSLARVLLVNSKVWESLDKPMRKYFKMDAVRKDAASRMLQVQFRKYLKKCFTFQRAMRRGDTLLIEKCRAVDRQRKIDEMLGLLDKEKKKEGPTSQAVNEVFLTDVDPTNDTVRDADTTSSAASINKVNTLIDIHKKNVSTVSKINYFDFTPDFMLPVVYERKARPLSAASITSKIDMGMSHLKKKSRPRSANAIAINIKPLDDFETNTYIDNDNLLNQVVIELILRHSFPYSLTYLLNQRVMSAPTIRPATANTVRFDEKDRTEKTMQANKEVARKLKRRNDRKYGLPYRELLKDPVKTTLSLDSSLKFLATVNPKYTENIKAVRKNRK